MHVCYSVILLENRGRPDLNDPNKKACNFILSLFLALNEFLAIMNSGFILGKKEGFSSLVLERTNLSAAFSSIFVAKGPQIPSLFAYSS